jgi:hypothetical protein
MEGVVAALQAEDPRFGFNGKRGNPDDLSHDAISYYHGQLPPSHGSYDVYVIDIIVGHCGPNPSVGWQNVTTPSARGAWVQSRSAGAMQVQQTGHWAPIGDGDNGILFGDDGEPIVGFVPQLAPFQES